MKQIEQNAQERLLDQERKDQESQQMLKYLEKLQMEDLRCCWKFWNKLNISPLVASLPEQGSAILKC